MGTEFRIGNKLIELMVVNGVVAQSSSSNSRDYSERFSNLMGGTYLHSESRREINFFLLRDDGREHAVSFPSQLALRSGHKVTVVYGMCADGKSVTAIGMFNETLGSSYELPVEDLLSRLDVKLGSAPVTKFVWWTLLAMFALTVLSAIFFKNWLNWTLGSGIFWLFLGGLIMVMAAGAYVIDPLIFAADLKKLAASFKQAMDGIAESRRASSAPSSAVVSVPSQD